MPDKSTTQLSKNKPSTAFLPALLIAELYKSTNLFDDSQESLL